MALEKRPKKFNPIVYTEDTPAQRESERMLRTREGSKRDVKIERSNGAVASAVAGRKLSGGARTKGGSL